MEAYELFQAAKALQNKEHKIDEAMNVYRMIIDTYPNSGEAENAQKAIDMIKNNHNTDNFRVPNNNNVISTIKGGFNPNYLSGFCKLMLLLGPVFILTGFILAGIISKPVNDAPLSSEIIRSLQNNLKVIYIGAGFIFGALCFVLASILYHLTFLNQLIRHLIEKEKTKTEIPTDVPNESFLRRYYHD